MKSTCGFNRRNQVMLIEIIQAPEQKIKTSLNIEN